MRVFYETWENLKKQHSGLLITPGCFEPMEQEDCYYFLYSTCKRGSSCGYRHNPYTKLNPVLCEEWDKTKKCREDCPFRHSYYHLKKNRSDDFCYWEDKETGCTKEFCEFRHRDPEKDAWKVDGVKSLSQIKKVKNLGQRATEFEMDPVDFENERRGKRLEKQLKAESRSQRLAEKDQNASEDGHDIASYAWDRAVYPTASKENEQFGEISDNTDDAYKISSEEVADRNSNSEVADRNSGRRRRNAPCQGSEPNSDLEALGEIERGKGEVSQVEEQSMDKSQAASTETENDAKRRKEADEEDLDREMAELDELMKGL